MTSLMNISLMIYFALVSLIGTLGNGIILLAYGNRWNSSKSTSVVFILVLACVDLWTCLIVVPTIAIMEYREFEVPTLLCRFYSFSKMLITTSSLIMSFIALDRFLNIAVPHYRLLNPRRVKFLLILFILIGVGLGILIALAFSSLPNREVYLANYTLTQLNESSSIQSFSTDISLKLKEENYSLAEIHQLLSEQPSVPPGAQLTNIHLTFKARHDLCFADTSIISDTLREVLKHVSSKGFFISIGIVTIFYTITFLLAIHRQNPRIQALKKSLNVLNKFDAYPSGQQRQSSAAHHQQSSNHLHHPSKQRNDSIVSYSPLYSSTESKKPSKKELQHISIQQYEMSSFVSNDDLEESNVLSTPRHDHRLSISEATSDDLHGSTERFSNAKQVSFQVENANEQQPLAFLSNSSDTDLTPNTGKYYRFPCPCSTTRQLLIKFHFAQPTLGINHWLCCCCAKKKSASRRTSEPQVSNAVEDEPSVILTPAPSTVTNHHHTNSETLKRQLYRHRLKQIRMASTFLIITVSFVLFYLPSTLTVEHIIRSPPMVYYLYLWTHALNPIIYCFMNISLRAYILSMLKCQQKRKRRGRNTTTGTMTTFER